jgi:hypothetical protein
VTTLDYLYAGLKGGLERNLFKLRIFMIIFCVVIFVDVVSKKLDYLMRAMDYYGNLLY